MNDLRLEFRSRNNVLWHAIFDTYDSVAAFCRQHGCSQTQVGRLLNLQESPYLREDGALSVLAQRLCVVTGLGHAALWPPDLYTGVIPPNGAAEIPSSRFVGLAAARRLALPPTQDDALEASDLSAIVGHVLRTLTPREEQVIRMRFGLGGESEQSREEIARSFGLQSECVRQIEAKAIRKLRHASRSHRLRPYHSPETYEQA